MIEQNKISFPVGGDAYEWISGSPIIEAGGNWNLWVLHEPGYLPKFGQYSPEATRVFGIGALDDAKALAPSVKKD